MAATNSKAIPFPFHDSLANRIANLITSDIEALEKHAFNMTSPTGWQSIFKRPYKAHYANMISKRAHGNPEALGRIVSVLRDYEQKAVAYTNKPDRRGRPLTQFIHDASAPDTLPDQPYRKREQDEQPAYKVVQAPLKNPLSAPQQNPLSAPQQNPLSAPQQNPLSAPQESESERAMREAIERELTSQIPMEPRGPDGNPIKRIGEPSPTKKAQDENRTAPTEQPTQSMDEDRVREIADEQILERVPDMAANVADIRIHAQVPGLIVAALTAMVPTRVEVKLPDNRVIDLGVQHKQFPMLLKTVTHFPVWLPGPAGSGKTTAAKNAAKALDVAFHHHGAVDNVYQLLGFIDAGGTYHGTSFRAAYENGGIFLWDEVDASNPAALVAFNAAIENGECVFPDKTVHRHAQCYFIAAANTYGTGATHEYVGRTKLDAATLDRFVMLDWNYDEELERAIAGDTPWTRYVQAVRAAVKAAGIKHLVTPRASIRGNSLLSTGIAAPTVIDMTIRKGLSEDQWVKITQRCGAYKHIQSAAA